MSIRAKSSNLIQYSFVKKDDKPHLAQKQTNMHDEMIKYKDKVESKRAKNILNRVSVGVRVKLTIVVPYVLSV